MDLVDFNYNCTLKSFRSCGINTNKKQMKKAVNTKKINNSIFPSLSSQRCCC